MRERIGPNATIRVEPGSHAVHLEDESVIERAVAELGDRS
jgi:hypothetical protein